MKARSLVVGAVFISGFAFAVSDSKSANPLPQKMSGKWKLTSLTCKGVPQTLDPISYVLSFDGAKGTYLVKTKAGCTQVEPETYQYPSDKLVTIQSGPRACTPNPCEADVAAKDCGKGGTVAAVKFDVSFPAAKTLVISTTDPNSIDCIGQGQSKPAVFTFAKE